ncbi:MAG: hypothetical protein EKK41_07345 [Hyphomicrobiales bacterium]|nr:MAG: hypothetical protein EKK41_07345 [Hyphomicrobiales bacterium]
MTDFRSLLAEQQAMDNCLDRYGRRIASGTHAIFSLRTHSGVRVANFEVGMHGPDGPLVTEIKRRSNLPVPAEIYDPVLRWVAELPQTLRQSAIEKSQKKIDADEVFAELIAPYVATHQEIVAQYGAITLHSLEQDLSKLAPRLGINSWPVRFERTSCG